MNNTISNKSKTEYSEQDSLESITKHKNLINDFYYEYNKPLPSCENLLDNFQIIQYKNITLPRLKLGNEYQFDKYQKPFEELFEKINIDFSLMKDFIQTINNKNKKPDIFHNNSTQNYTNNKIDTKQLTDGNNIIDINNENKKIKEDKNDINSANNEHLDIFISNLKKSKNQKNFFRPNKLKSSKKIFNLDLYDKDLNLIHKKRGRKTLKKTQYHTHNALDNDNILRKIQVHFLTFLVSFTNDYIDALLPNLNKKTIHFLQLDYMFKRTINYQAIENMKSLTIGTILQKQASPKHKTYVKNINHLIYDKLCQLCPNLKKNYFNKLFKEFFIEYYYNKNENKVLLNGIKVNLSNKTQQFHFLLNKNKNNSEKFRKIAAYFFIKNAQKKEKTNENKKTTEGQENNITSKPFFIID